MTNCISSLWVIFNDFSVSAASLSPSCCPGMPGVSPEFERGAIISFSYTCIFSNIVKGTYYF